MLISDSRAALLIAIGTVYGPPPTRNSGPGVVTLTWGVGVGVPAGLAGVAAAVLSVDMAAAAPGGGEAGDVGGGPSGEVGGDDGGVPTPLVGGTGVGAEPGVGDVKAGDGCENPGGFGCGGGWVVVGATGAM